MGWSSGTRYFDAAAKIVFKYVPEEKQKQEIEKLLILFNDGDWDGEYESNHWDNPIFKKAYKELNPDYEDDE